MVMLSRSRMLLATTFIPSLKGRESRRGSRCLLCLPLCLLDTRVRRAALVERAGKSSDGANELLRNSGEDAMLSVRRRAITLKCISTSLTVIAALAVFHGACRAAEDPAKALQSEFQAAKTSLAAGDLPGAESHYVDTIALGLRQLTHISLSVGETDQAASYLD